MVEVSWLRYIMFKYQVFLDCDWVWMCCHWVECDWTKFCWPYVKSFGCSNVSLDEIGQVRRVGLLSDQFIILTQVYDWFGIGTQWSWYRLVQLSRIGTSCLMCSWYESDWMSCMSSWFDLGGLSLVCSWLDSDWLSQMMWATDWLVQLDWTCWLYRLMSSVIQWTVISWRVVIRWWPVVSSGSGCAVRYRLCSVV